ncbi:MAG: aldehyde-activating protein [Betaproteobacteria bacterium]|nr:aldehyde-activating protein [Betaproteobacteria bacterium]
MHQLDGSCHCGNIRVLYRTAVAPEEARPRACQCTFCRKHNTRAISDPGGTLAITVDDQGALNRYRFGLGAAEFLICRTCGVYVAAFMADPHDDQGYATLMANVLEAQGRYPEAAPTVYDNEDEAGRRARRRQRWTPATLRKH